MQRIILAQGPPPLTQDAADAAIDAIDVIAAAVRGYDAIDVTEIVRPIWRSHLAYWYPHLLPEARQWYANAPAMVDAIHAQWPQLNDWERGAVLQQWALQLPQLLWMLDPVLAAARVIEMQEAQRAQLEAFRYTASTWQAPVDSEAELFESLDRKAQMTARLQSYSTQMANSTIDLMRAFNRRVIGKTAVAANRLQPITWRRSHRRSSRATRWPPCSSSQAYRTR